MSYHQGLGAAASKVAHAKPPKSPFDIGVGGGWSHKKGGQQQLATGLAGPISAQTVGGPPVDPAQESYNVTAGRNLGLAQGDAAYQQGQLDYNYGYGAGGAANPYSRAALLQESYKRNVLGTTNNMNASGQLYSGANGRAQNENSRQYSIASDANRGAYDRASHDINYGIATAAANTGIGMDDASYQALLRSLGLA